MFIKNTSGVSSHARLHTYQEGFILPVLSADELLFSSRHKGLLRQFRDLSDLSESDFDRTYGALIHDFMEFVQVLPHKTNGILGSLLNYSLARASAVLQKYCALRKNQTTPLLKFAVFSASLLKEVGRVITNQRVVLVDEEGDYIQDWNCFSGAMIKQARFYKMYPLSAAYLRLETETAPLLARQLLSEDAFVWLSGDIAVFSDWLAALLNEEGVASKEITWVLNLIKREDILAILNTLDGAEVAMQEPAKTQEGEAFYKWLKEQITQDKLSVNKEDSGIFVVPEGVLIEQKIFKQFSDIANRKIDRGIVMAQFCNFMGIVAKGANDFVVRKYFTAGEASVRTFSGAQKGREGVVVSADRVFLNGKTPETSALRSASGTVSAQHQAPTNLSNMPSNNSNPTNNITR